MARRSKSVHLPLDHGNPAEQRLSSYRMSMLAHGFVDRDDKGLHEFVPDESGPMNYAVVKLRQRGSLAIGLLAIAIAVTIAVVVIFA